MYISPLFLSAWLLISLGAICPCTVPYPSCSLRRPCVEVHFFPPACLSIPAAQALPLGRGFIHPAFRDREDGVCRCGIISSCTDLVRGARNVGRYFVHTYDTYYLVYILYILYILHCTSYKPVFCLLCSSILGYWCRLCISASGWKKTWVIRRKKWGDVQVPRPGQLVRYTLQYVVACTWKMTLAYIYVTGMPYAVLLCPPPSPTCYTPGTSLYLSYSR